MKRFIMAFIIAPLVPLLLLITIFPLFIVALLEDPQTLLRLYMPIVFGAVPVYFYVLRHSSYQHPRTSFVLATLLGLVASLAVYFLAKHSSFIGILIFGLYSAISGYIFWSIALPKELVKENSPHA
jgi:hypothetical protein